MLRAAGACRSTYEHTSAGSTQSHSHPCTCSCPGMLVLAPLGHESSNDSCAMRPVPVVAAGYRGVVGGARGQPGRFVRSKCGLSGPVVCGLWPVAGRLALWPGMPAREAPVLHRVLPSAMTMIAGQ